MQSLKVLIAEDSASDAELMLHELRHAGYVTTAVRTDTEEAFRANLSPQVDIILADYVMPQFGALRALEIARESGFDIPFIIVSGSIEEDLAVDAMRKGADDYLLKDRLSRLGQAVAHALRAHALRHEKQLALEQLRLHDAALHAAANAIVITDRQGRILWTNPAFESLTGYRLEEIQGRNPRFLKSDRQDSAFYRRLWETIASGQVWRGELLNRRKDGTEYREEMTITPVKNPEGHITHFIAIKQDITERTNLQTQLFHAQKLDSIGNLAGGIAHDFNNLLVAIMGFTELALINLEETGKARADLQEVKNASERAARLTRQLLAFSRKQTIEARALDLNELIVGLQPMLERLLGEDITLTTDLAPDLKWIKADPGQIEQVIMNLAVNARDAMPRGGRLTLRTGNRTIRSDEPSDVPGAREGSFAALTVLDTGSGIPPDILAHIFEPFFTTKESGKGTGLGLSVVYGIVKQHDGWMTVSSRPGEGTVFTAYLPHVPSENHTVSATIASGEERKKGSGECVLIVEDDAGVRHFANRLLTANGYRTHCVADGNEALDVLESRQIPVDMLFCDAILPGINGYDLAERISLTQHRIKIVITSGHTENKARISRARAAGWRILPKPYTADALLGVLYDSLHEQERSTV